MAEALIHRIHRKAIEAGLLPVGGAGKARVLMYHGIGERGCSAVNKRHLGVDLFERHLRLYGERFHITTLDRLVLGERDPAKLTIALTFDDGLRNNLTHALPLLEKYGVPATWFITGANPAGLRCLWGDLLDLAERTTDRPLVIHGEHFTLNAAKRYASDRDGTLLNHRIKQLGVFAPKQELYDQLGDLLDGPLKERTMFWTLMKDEELRTVARHPLIRLGSHGWWHNDMGRIPIEDAREELRQSKAYLEGLTGGTVTSLAWSAGSYSPATIDAAGGLGFSTQLAVDHLYATDSTDVRIMDRYGVYDFPVRDRYLSHLISRGAR